MESKVINPELKSRINKIDFELKQFFENVYIKDQFYKTGFFEIKANKVSYLKESKEYKRLEVKVIINQPDLLQDLVKWSYTTNPLNENALWIDRFSELKNISAEIINIVKEVRFDESYIMDLEPIVDVIHEDLQMEVIEKEYDIQDSIFTVLENHKVDVTMKQSQIHSINENFLSNPSDRILRFYHNNDLKISEKFKIESEMLAIENVNWCLFKEEYLEVNYTPSF